MTVPQPREAFRFGDFELDVTSYELRREGGRVRLERRPMDLLILLVQRRGDLITRGEIVERLWGQDVFITEAFQLYLQGLHAWNQLKPPQTTQRALELYTRATQLDPGYALPWAGLAIAYAGAPINGDADPRKVGSAVRRTAAQAVAAEHHIRSCAQGRGQQRGHYDGDPTCPCQSHGFLLFAQAQSGAGRRMVSGKHERRDGDGLEREWSFCEADRATRCAARSQWSDRRSSRMRRFNSSNH